MESSTLPKFNMEPEKLPKPNRKGSSSNHLLSGAMLNFGRVVDIFFREQQIFGEVPKGSPLSPDVAGIGGCVGNLGKWGVSDSENRENPKMDGL